MKTELAEIIDSELHSLDRFEEYLGCEYAKFITITMQFTKKPPKFVAKLGGDQLEKGEAIQVAFELGKEMSTELAKHMVSVIQKRIEGLADELSAYCKRERRKHD